MNEDKKWYQKKRYLIPTVILSIWGLSSAFSTPDQPVVVQHIQGTVYTQPLQQPANAYQAPAPYKAPVAPQTNTLSNNNYYTNVDGNSVHAPAYADQAPDGATAQCGDGTYSFSLNHRGTCSHHGGVAEWLD